MPLTEREAKDAVAARHHEWTEHELRWKFLLDSLEGADRYRQAIYGYDSRGYPLRNLVRHKREFPDPRGLAGQSTNNAPLYALAFGDSTARDATQVADSDDYELRRARTPVPTFVPEAVSTYVSTIFGCEVDREAPAGPVYDHLRDWWQDVDGEGTTIDEWMEDTVGPLLLTFGQLDLLFDHPAPPDGQTIRSKADASRADLTRCVASHVLPQNLIDWSLNPDGTYATCLILEHGELDPYAEANDEDEGRSDVRFRYWTATESTLLDGTGKILGDPMPHRFGRVPIQRIYDSKKPRCRHVGQPRFNALADRQREYYNRDSELILSDSHQAHPILQGPEEYCDAGNTVPIGPGYLLPMKGSGNQGDRTYQGFEVVDFPKGASESLRMNMLAIRDDCDRDAKLTKPAGAAGTGKGTVAQSGVSKEFDHEGLHKQLSKVAKRLARAERSAALMALAVLFDGQIPPEANAQVKISYPTVFNLRSAEDLAQIATDVQAILAAAGDAPQVETALVCEILRKALPGRDDETYERLDAEIEQAIAAKASSRDEAAEAGTLALPNPGEPAPVAADEPDESDVPTDDETEE